MLASRRATCTLFSIGVWAIAAAPCVACGTSSADEIPFGAAGNTAGANGERGSGGRSAGQSAAGGALVTFGGASAGSTGGGTSIGGSCGSQSSQAEVVPVYLAFVFDVSGSMGKGDQPWHNKSLKWDPVVAATKAFFIDSASQGLNASLTFFPTGSNSQCSQSSYRNPDVPMTALPSTVFGKAIDAVGAQSWRGGTPTLAALQGVISTLKGNLMAKAGRYAIVLVTDGYPQGCSDDSISSVVSAVSAVAAEIPTYVIGVKNPPIQGAPDTVTNLTQVAQAGRTDHAHIIDTGDPTRTTADLTATINAIRKSSISCELAIPAPPSGSKFDKQNVAVIVTTSGNRMSLSYDATCQIPNAWHYDQAASPTRIVLCASACNALQLDATATLRVEFTCEAVIQVPL
ncbi:MAG: vWA domain-containing protein [Myxococcota bacterium]